MEDYTENEEHYKDEGYYDKLERNNDEPYEPEAEDARDPYDCEYDGQPSEQQEWEDYDPDC
jgi:hypothetical protein